MEINAKFTANHFRIVKHDDQYNLLQHVQYISINVLFRIFGYHLGFVSNCDPFYKMTNLEAKTSVFARLVTVDMKIQMCLKCLYTQVERYGMYTVTLRRINGRYTVPLDSKTNRT